MRVCGSADEEFSEEVRKEVEEGLVQVEEALDHLDDLLEAGDATHKFAFKQLKAELTGARRRRELDPCAWEHLHPLIDPPCVARLKRWEKSALECGWGSEM